MNDEPFPGSSDDMMNTIAALRARVAKLEAALKEIASRWRFSNTDELGDIAADALSETVKA